MKQKKSGVDDEAGVALKFWGAGLAALMIAVSVGLVTADVRQGKRLAKKPLQTDANSQRKAAKVMAEAPFWQSEEDIDEVLARPDEGSSQHG